jgi:hypothetical protein
MSGPKIGQRLKLSLQIVVKGFEFLRICDSESPWCEQGGRRSRNSHHPIRHLPQRLVFGIEGFECLTTLVLTPLIEWAGHRPLQAVDLGFQSGVPRDLPPPSQPVLQAYFILNAGRIRGRGLSRMATFGNRCHRGCRSAPGKFSTHVSIVIPLCNSELNVI